MQKKRAVEQAAETAAELFGNGYHCAEAIVVSVLEEMSEDSSSVVKYATGFGGGYGESFCEACGVISGALVVIGHFYGRQQQRESWRQAAIRSTAMIQRFEDRNQTTNCGILRERFGKEMQMECCRELVRTGTRDLIDILNSRCQ